MQFIHTLAQEVLAKIARRKQSNEPVGVPTGVDYIDKELGGLPRQMMSYLVGDSGVGKTCLATFMLLHAAQWLKDRNKGPASAYTYDEADAQRGMTYRRQVARKDGKVPIVVFWSLEMAEQAVISRMWAQATRMSTGVRLNHGQLLRGNLESIHADKSQDELAKAFGLGTQTLQELGPHIAAIFRDRTIAEFRQTLAELSMRYDVCMVIVDYFRLIQDAVMDVSGAARQEAISRELMAIARDFDCHVLSVFDLNREGQKSEKPALFHMKWGSGAQYDADYIFIMWWTKEDRLWMREHGDTINATVVLELAKARDAPLGQTRLAFELDCGYFEPFIVKEKET
jgi:replicative DNA helicase